ncbi:FAD-binding protein [soil metagenome]
MSAIRANWSNHHTFLASKVHQPQTIAEVQELVANRAKIGVFGARHSFNGIADSPGDLLSLEHLDKVVAIDAERRTVTVEGGIRYWQLGPALHEAGFALHNLASLPHISVAGAIATGTHGSGDRNGTLSSAVAALDFVTASGDLLHLHRGDPDFAGAVVSLGALGIVTHVTLDLQPTFDVRQDVYTGLSWDALVDGFDTVTSSAYSVSVFTNWMGAGPTGVWLKTRLPGTPPTRLLDAEPLVTDTHMLDAQPPQNTTTQGGVPGPWSDRLAHFRLEFTPSAGEEIQSEYLVPRANALAAIEAMRALGPRFQRALLVTELRTMAADDLWLSPAQGRDTVGVHFTWRRDPDAVYALLPAIEDALLPLGARPHWGKAFVATDVADQYPHWNDFRLLRDRMDPTRKFAGPLLARVGL